MWQGTNNNRIAELDRNKMIERLPKCFLNAKTEEAVIRLLALQWRLDNTKELDWESVCYQRNKRN